MKLLKLLHLEAVKNQHPFELSMGQKRRLSVATALSSKADIILLDEPTFGLDSHNTFQLIELFKKASLVVKPSLWLHTTLKSFIAIQHVV